MNKRAQFFIIAALITSGIILGTSAVRNYAREEVVQTETLDLSEEIAYEAHNVLDTGFFQAEEESVTQKKIETLVKEYGVANPDSDIQIIYGQPNNLTQITYDNSEATPEIKERESILTTSNNKVSEQEGRLQLAITLPDESTVTREVTLTEGEQVFIIIKKRIRNDQVVTIAT